MTEQQKAPRRKRGRFGLWLLSSLLFLGILLGLVVLGLTGRPLPAPAWLVEKIEARANTAIEGHGRLDLGGVELIVERGFVPRVRLRNALLFNAAGVKLAELPELRVTLRAEPLLRGRLEPWRMRLFGAKINLTRDMNGDFGLMAAGGDQIPSFEVGTPAEIMALIDKAFAIPLLAGLTTVEASDMAITLQDARSGQRWQVTNGHVALTQDAQLIGLAVDFNLAGKGAETRPAAIDMSFSSRKGTSEARFSANVTDVSAKDLAAQSPGLAWLGVLDAPISGAFRSGVSAEGEVSRLDGSLEIGAGSLSPTPGVKPVAFDAAKVKFTYDNARRVLDFEEMSLDGASLKVRATARAWLQGGGAGLPTGMMGQLRISELLADPEGLFADPVAFSHGAVDFKLTPEPFRVQIGQMVLVEDGKRIRADGEIFADETGWTVAMDLGVDAISHERMLALWPLGLVPKTREWIATNVATGELFNVTAALRLRPEQEPRLWLGYEFRGAEVRVVRTLPPVKDATGYATTLNNVYTLVLDRGHLTAPVGGRVDVAGSVMRVPDIRIIPAPAEITLMTDSTITAALSLLDQPPFSFLSKANKPVDIAEGRARARTRLNMILKEKVDPAEVTYTVTAELTDVRTTNVIEGRTILSDRLELRATEAGMSISGPGTVSGLPFNTTWTQGFLPEERGKSRVDGTVELSQRFLDTLGIALPKGMMTGEGFAKVEVFLAKDTPPRVQFFSDLNGVRLSVPEINWSKPVGTPGRLVVMGVLDETPRIEALALTAPGLKIAGTVALKPGGAFDRARLTEVDIGWFRGSVDLRGRGAGAPVGVAIQGGTADMRRATFGSGGSGAGSGAPLSVALDRLRISEGIALTGFRGEFTTRGGMSGRFQARVNGAAAIEGSVAPDPAGSIYRITSADAGAVFAATGAFSRARGGAMDLTLRPKKAKGTYDGRLRVDQIRVRDAPVLAEILGAVSGVGLLEQLGGEGILFNTMSSHFTLAPDVIAVHSGRATGASMGVTLTGYYTIANSALRMEGVVSPVYFVNSLGQVVSRKGEGLFGFTYRLTGDATNPKVRVNPLSILAPGFFREIFRKKAPEVEE